MATRGHWQLLTSRGMRYGAGVLACATTAALAGTAPAGATAGRPVQHGSATHSAASGPVSPRPANGTPELATTGTAEQVRQLVQCGGTMYAVGSFTKIKWHRTTFSRNNVFRFKATSPFTVSRWNPDVNGEVNSIAFKRGNCADAYIGGSFTSVHGRSVKNLAKISTGTGAVVSRFQSNANNQIYTMLVTPNGHLFVGGGFSAINGGADKRYASLNLSTGKDDGYLHLHITGHYVYPGVHSNETSVYNQQLSPNGSEVLAEGVFTSVGGQPRQQIFMLHLGAGHATVTGWHPTEFNQHCATKHPLYVKAATWSPGGSTVYTANTGRNLWNWNGKFPLTGPCDAVLAFPATHGTVHHTWINYAGCDSFFSVAADQFAVYASGHERWADNQNGCNHPGPGSIPARGLGGFNPRTGALLKNPKGTIGRYTRARGFGSDDLLVTRAGLWDANDNFEGANSCGGVGRHAGICFLPYR